MNSNHSDIVIIGGGLGGLFSGAFLARNGLKVTVLEKNSIIGGGLQCFSRCGKIYETGMHILGGFNHGGSLSRICNYLGIEKSLNLKPVDSECMDEILDYSTGETIRIAPGRTGFIESLSKVFPDERKNLKAYVDAIYRLSEEVPLFNMRPSEGIFQKHSPEFLMSVGDFIASYTDNPRLRLILAYFNPLFGGIPDETPAYINALISVLYINGPCRFCGGSQQLASLLEGIIIEAGGKVLPGKEVVSIKTNGSKIAVSAETADGGSFSADKFISAVHPLLPVDMLPDNSFTKAYVNRLKNIPLSASAFSLYIDLLPDKIPYINHPCYYMDSPAAIWSQYNPSDKWPEGLMYMTPPETSQGKYASRILVHTIMDWSEVEPWADSRFPNRPPEYLAWKEGRVKAVLAKLRRAIPDIDSAIKHIYASSPLTIRDFYHTPNGALFGYRKDCNNIMQSQIPVYTKIPNLFLTGQNINLHGICGVPLTAILTCEAILGTNFLVNEINKSYDRQV